MSDSDRVFQPNTSSVTSASRQAVRGRARFVLQGVVGLVLFASGILVGVSLPRTSDQPASPATSSTPAVQSATGLPERDIAEIRETAFETLGAALFGIGGGAVDWRKSVQEGAVRAWLFGPSDPKEEISRRGPLYPVTVWVSRATDWYDIALRLSSSVPYAECFEDSEEEEYVLDYTVVFEYGDGSLVPARGVVNQCGIVTDGTTAKEGALRFYELLTELWEEGRPADFEASVEPCTAIATLMAARPEEVVSGALCQEYLEGDASKLRVISLLTDEQVGAVVDSIVSGRSTRILSENNPSGKPDDSDGERVFLQLANRAGDLLTLTRSVDGSGNYYYEKDKSPKPSEPITVARWTPDVDLPSVD